MKKIIIIMLMFVSFYTFAFAKQFYWNDFSRESLGTLPQGWEQAFKGEGEAMVIKDPINPNNKVLASSDISANQARHDVGGSIFSLGEKDWKDYIVELDAYFPEEYYMGVLFRFEDSEAFYLFDRRSGGEKGNFDFWKRQAGGWTGIQRGGKFETEPKKWYRFRIVVKGDTFEAYGKSKDDETPFEKIKSILTGKDATFKTGKVALYGLIYIDNLVIGETEADLILPVELAGKLTQTWAKIKAH